MAIITIPLATLKATASFASTEVAHYYLNGVYIHIANDGTLRLVATDGHRMAIVKPLDTLHDKQFEAFIMPDETIKLLKGNAKKHFIKAEIDTEKRTISVTDHNKPTMTLHYEPIDGTFPDYMRVIPDAKNFGQSCSTASFNPKYLGAFEAFGNGVQMFPNKDAQAPHILRCKTQQHDVLGIVMPMRYDEMMTAHPEWLHAVKPKASLSVVK